MFFGVRKSEVDETPVQPGAYPADFPGARRICDIVNAVKRLNIDDFFRDDQSFVICDVEDFPGDRFDAGGGIIIGHIMPKSDGIAYFDRARAIDAAAGDAGFIIIAV